MLLQPIPGDLHQDGPIRRAKEILVRCHQATGIIQPIGQTIIGCPRNPAIDTFRHNLVKRLKRGSV